MQAVSSGGPAAAGGKLQEMGCRVGRTSSCEVLVKDRSMAPATLPAARKGPVGQKESVALRCACLSTVIALQPAPQRHNACNKRLLSAKEAMSG